jgi:glycosyltransferase involved in cell wall biosynthesis
MHVRSSGALLGAERVVLELARSSPAWGYDAIIVALQDEGDPAPEMCAIARQEGIESASLLCRRGFDRALPARLAEIARLRGVSLLHSHGYKEDIHIAMARGRFPLVATNHLWKRTDWRLRLYAALDALALRRFDHVVAVSGPVLDDMVRAMLPREKMSVIPNGIDVSAYRTSTSQAARRDARIRLGLPPDGLVAMSVSSLTVEKGHRYMLEALAAVAPALPELDWVVVGDGPLRQSLEQQVDALSIGEHVRFLGARRDVASLLQVADIFVLPSLIEGLPIALLEAMAAGLASIATSTGDIPSVIDHGRNGLLCLPGCSPELESAVRRYASDAQLRALHGANARASVLERFSATRMAERYCHLYDKVLSPGCPGP